MMPSAEQHLEYGSYMHGINPSVFACCQYPAALDLVGLALSTNGIKHVSLTAGGRGVRNDFICVEVHRLSVVVGFLLCFTNMMYPLSTQGVRRAIAAFREDEEVKVFLLAHRLGAAGRWILLLN